MQVSAVTVLLGTFRLNDKITSGDSKYTIQAGNKKT